MYWPHCVENKNARVMHSSGNSRHQKKKCLCNANTFIRFLYFKNVTVCFFWWSDLTIKFHFAMFFCNKLISIYKNCRNIFNYYVKTFCLKFSTSFNIFFFFLKFCASLSAIHMCFKNMLCLKNNSLVILDRCLCFRWCMHNTIT